MATTTSSPKTSAQPTTKSSASATKPASSNTSAASAKYALVTGGNRGIGYGIVKGLAEAGFTVFLGSRNKSAGEKAASELSTSTKGTIIAVTLDVTDERSVKQALADVKKKTQKIDVLVNNAGSAFDYGKSVFDMTDDDFNKTMDLNVLGVLRTTKEFIPLLKNAEAPRIINVSSRGGQLSGEPEKLFAPAYCISKTALNMLTQAMTAELPFARVNSMCPGWVRTDLGGAGATKSIEEGADTAIWLASEAPSTINGSFIAERKVIPW